jgi:hypothetical protein
MIKTALMYAKEEKEPKKIYTKEERKQIRKALLKFTVQEFASVGFDWGYCPDGFELRKNGKFIARLYMKDDRYHWEIGDKTDFTYDMSDFLKLFGKAMAPYLGD